MQIQSGFRKILEISGLYNIFQTLIGKKKTKKWLLKNIWKISNGDKIVDMGCGPATKLAYLPNKIDYFGFDISKKYIEAAKKKYSWANFIQAKASDFLTNGLAPLQNTDLIMCNGLLHHLEDNEVNEILELSNKILKPKGRLICIEPVFLKHHSKISRWLISKDRGQNIRTEEEYKNLVSKFFNSYNTSIVTGLTKIPYVHIIIECAKQ
jgi:SAM-dependent methyltransferase